MNTENSQNNEFDKAPEAQLPVSGQSVGSAELDPPIDQPSAPAVDFQPEVPVEPATEQKSSRKSAIIIVVALVVVVALGIVGYNVLGSNGNAQNAASIDDSTNISSAENIAGNPTLQDLNSVIEDEMENSYDMVGIADGKPLVVNFWATWCPHCVKEMSDFQAIYDEFGESISFAFIDCVDGTRETVEDGSAYIYENGYTFPVYYDTKSNAQIDYGITGLPTTVVFDKDGTVVYAMAGAIDPSSFTLLLDGLAE